MAAKKRKRRKKRTAEDGGLTTEHGLCHRGHGARTQRKQETNGAAEKEKAAGGGLTTADRVGREEAPWAQESDDGGRIVAQRPRSADTEADAERLRPLNLKSAVED